MLFPGEDYLSGLNWKLFSHHYNLLQEHLEPDKGSRAEVNAWEGLKQISRVWAWWNWCMRIPTETANQRSLSKLQWPGPTGWFSVTGSWGWKDRTGGFRRSCTSYILCQAILLKSSCILVVDSKWKKSAETSTLRDETNRKLVKPQEEHTPYQQWQKLSTQ